MIENILLLAQENDGFRPGLDFRPLWEDHGTPLAIMGIMVVFAALLLISMFITLLPRLTAILTHYHPVAGTHPPATVAPRRSKDELSEEIMVVIAAAVAEVIEQPHRIIRTRQLSRDELAWSFEGRSKLHASHMLPHRDNR